MSEPVEPIEILPIAQQFLAERIAIGTREYGEPLRTDTQIDRLRYLQEELADALLYVTDEIECRERGIADSSPPKIAEAAKWFKRGGVFQSLAHIESLLHGETTDAMRLSLARRIEEAYRHGFTQAMEIREMERGAK